MNVMSTFHGNMSGSFQDILSKCWTADRGQHAVVCNFNHANSPSVSLNWNKPPQTLKLLKQHFNYHNIVIIWNICAPYLNWLHRSPSDVGNVELVIHYWSATSCCWSISLWSSWLLPRSQTGSSVVQQDGWHALLLHRCGRCRASTFLLL